MGTMVRRGSVAASSSGLVPGCVAAMGMDAAMGTGTVVCMAVGMAMAAMDVGATGMLAGRSAGITLDIPGDMEATAVAFTAVAGFMAADGKAAFGKQDWK